MNDMSVIDYGISNRTVEEKRNILYRLDLKLKHLHASGCYLYNFNLDKISIDVSSMEPFFDEVYTADNIRYYDIDQYKKLNLLWLTSFAICIYLPDYHLENGLLNLEVLRENFDDIKNFIPDDDVDYYANVLNSMTTGTTITYFSDYINGKVGDGKINASIKHYNKSTPIGRAFSSDNSEIGSVNYFFVTCLVFCLVLLMIFGIICLTN